MSEAATLLSPSQVQCFTECSARWWFRYGLGLPDPKNGTLALGIAVHDAIAEHFRAKIAGAHLDPADAAEAFDGSWWDQLEGDTILREEDDPAELRATGRALASRYVAEAAPAIRPAAVEEKVEGIIAGVRVQGRIDIREEDGTIRDIKTACRRPSGVSAAHRFQLATYVQITPAAAGVTYVDTLVKTKQPQLVQISHRIDSAEIRQTQVMYPLTQDAMRAGLYVPNRAAALCSRKHCAFWKNCQNEFGGSVSQC
jgi:RecB family exonuclease